MRTLCNQVLKRLAAGQAGSEMPAALQEHARLCERCSSEARAFGGLRTALRGMAAAETSSLRWEHLRGRLAREGAPIRRTPVPALSACAVLAACAAVWLLSPADLAPGRVTEAERSVQKPAAGVKAPARLPKTEASATRADTLAAAPQRIFPPSAHPRKARATRTRAARRAAPVTEPRKLVADSPVADASTGPEFVVVGSVEHVLPAAHSADYSPDVDYVMDEVTPVARPVAVRL